MQKSLDQRTGGAADQESGLHEECGVFGIYDLDGGNVASSIYYGLFALQHRGQESCGIAVSETNGPKRTVHSHKGLGLVNDVFNEDNLEGLVGNLGVGHVRYATAGATKAENAMPLVLNYVKGILAISHNGNLINARELRKELEYTGAIFQTTIDSEVIAYHIARERLKTDNVETAVRQAVQKVRGAYSMVVMSARKLIGVRDPLGLHPLCIGRKGNTYVITSESCALAANGMEFIRDVEPGEMVTITRDGEILSDKTMQQERQARCIFEYIYFARPDSVIDGVSVYHSRIVSGKALAQSYPVEADLVVGVPDSGIAAAKGYSEESGIPYGIAFHKNSYVGRTFIKPKQSQRVSSVKIKLNVLGEVVKGKRVVMVDDSIVRGTTSANIIKMLKRAGATEVHVRISSPPFLYPCYFGTDVPSNDQLIAHSHSTEEICEKIGADSLGYMEIDKLQQMVGDLGYCDACFTGNYPMEVPDDNIRDVFE